MKLPQTLTDCAVFFANLSQPSEHPISAPCRLRSASRRLGRALLMARIYHDWLPLLLLLLLLLLVLVILLTLSYFIRATLRRYDAAARPFAS